MEKNKKKRLETWGRSEELKEKMKGKCGGKREMAQSEKRVRREEEREGMRRVEEEWDKRRK